MRNFIEDKDDALAVAHLYGIETREVDLTLVKSGIVKALGKSVTPAASANVGPRLRMTTLYTIAASENRLVAGTSNRSEIYMGYFTKHGDGASDFNPIADLTVSEVLEFLRFLKAPDSIVSKVPSAGLFEGQTDESDMGISYRSIDEYLLYGNASSEDRTLMELAHSKTEHKRKPPLTFM
jgi:NAD+ synthase